MFSLGTSDPQKDGACKEELVNSFTSHLKRKKLTGQKVDDLLLHGILKKRGLPLT